MTLGVARRHSRRGSLALERPLVGGGAGLRKHSRPLRRTQATTLRRIGGKQSLGCRVARLQNALVCHYKGAGSIND